MTTFSYRTNTFARVLTLAFFFFFGISHTVQAALDNHIMVIRNNSIVFDAADGIESAPQIQDILIDAEPLFGILEINSDQTLTFAPYQDICEEKDNFSYLILTSAGVDTINVSVDIICEKLTVISGFSPNGDGVNDTFTVIGSEAYPHNSLVVFNKWGEEVYAKMNYKNTWDGTDKNNESLVSEENVFYYVFDDGEGNVYSGYMKIE